MVQEHSINAVNILTLGRRFLFLVFVFFASTLRSETVHLEWTKRFGGSGSDTLSVVRRVLPSGYIAGGTSLSGVSGTKTSTNWGGTDLWVVRLNDVGEQQWDKTFGGARNPSFPTVLAYDYLNSLIQRPDGGFLLVGESNDSVGGSKTAIGNGTWDMYAVNIDDSGNQVWDKAFGTSKIESAADVVRTSDGNYVLVGWREINSTNSDVWVVKVSTNGSVLWEHTYGGSGPDHGVAIVETSDGGFYVAAESASEPFGSKTSPNYGGGYINDWTGDFWILRLDPQGNKIAEQSIGGVYDEKVGGLQATADGGVIVAGDSYSPASGNKSSTNAGYTDGWIVRLDAALTKLWDVSLGGMGYDGFSCIEPMEDKGFILGGGSNSQPWFVRIDASGKVLWQQTVALEGAYGISSLDRTTDSGFIVGGTTYLGSGYGNADFAIAKLSPEPPRLFEFSSDVLQGFHLNVLSPAGTCVVEWSTNCVDWFPLQTNLLPNSGGIFSVTDFGVTNCTQKFFRASTF